MPVFRDYTPDDRDGCLAIFDSNCPGFLDPLERPEFAAWLDAPEGRYLVLVEDAEPVGCGGFVVEDGALRLNWGLLRADRHGRGLGEALLLRRLVGGLEATGAPRASLATSPAVEPFFARHGFRRVGYTKDGWAPGMDRVDVELDASEPVLADLRARWDALKERLGLSG